MCIDSLYLRRGVRGRHRAAAPPALNAHKTNKNANGRDLFLHSFCVQIRIPSCVSRVGASERVGFREDVCNRRGDRGPLVLRLFTALCNQRYL